MARILICDDEEILCRSLARALRASGYEVVTADGPGGLGRIGTEQLDLILTDIRMPEVSGFQIIKTAGERTPQTPVIAMSGCAEIHDAVRAMHAGAVDFLVKPFELEALEDAVRNALGPAPTPSNGTDPLVWRDRHAQWLVGEDPAMHPVLELLSQAAETHCSVLIVGESGTGKDMIARSLHAGSPRRERPFVAVPCSALVPELAEAELFGQAAQGTLTGAAPQPGRLAQADGGTVLLDDVGHLSSAIQAKLMRLIQDGELIPVGAQTASKLDVRFLASSTQRLDAEVAAGRFRADLFWRLNVVPIELPPLRKRPSDVPRLAQHFVARANHRHERRVRGIEQRAMSAMMAYAWPGNVRELENLIERLVIVRGHGMLGLSDLPPVIRTPREVTPIAVPLDLPAEGADLRATLDAIEQRMIGEALVRAGGNKNRAAELLGLNRTTLVEKLRRRRAGSEQC